MTNQTLFRSTIIAIYLIHEKLESSFLSILPFNFSGFGLLVGLADFSLGHLCELGQGPNVTQGVSEQPDFKGEQLPWALLLFSARIYTFSAIS